jgi:hypothetical protein
VSLFWSATVVFTPIFRLYMFFMTIQNIMIGIEHTCAACHRWCTCPQLVPQGPGLSVRPRPQPRHTPTREVDGYDEVVATHMENRYVSGWTGGLAGRWVTAAEAHGRWWCRRGGDGEALVTVTKEEFGLKSQPILDVVVYHELIFHNFGGMNLFFILLLIISLWRMKWL